MNTKFEDLKVSTRTIIATASVQFDITQIFNEAPLISKIFSFHGQNHKISIERMSYKNKIRDKNSKEVLFNIGTQKSFRNALNVIMMLDDNKKVNFKVSKNGKFQITGCREIDHAKLCTFSFMEIIAGACPEYMETTSELFSIHYEVVMTNVDCGTGYCINRQSLDKIINSTTSYNSLLETSFGYTGVNIKFPVEKDWINMDIPSIEWILTKPETLELKNAPLSQVAPDRKYKKKYNTFLVFHSGRFIMSGMKEETMGDDYHRFINILHNNENQIKEILDT